MNYGKNAGSRHPETVLIVDDDADELQLTHRVVAEGCPHMTIKDVRSGAELIDYLKGEHGFSDRVEFPYPVLILLDLRMPGMHGFEVLAWLTTHPPHNEVPVVVLTGSGEVVLTQQSYALGARSFLTKPLNATELKHTMETIGNLESLRGSPRAPTPPASQPRPRGLGPA